MSPTNNRKPDLQKNASRKNARPRLHSPGLFAKSPAIGLTMFLSGSLIFGLLAYQLKTSEALLAWDMTIAKTFRDAQINAAWSLMEDILFGVFLGKEVVVVTGMILATYFLYQQFWRELAMIVIGLGGGALIWVVLARYFDRPGPADHLEVLPLSGPSFPSGPALMAVLCYGLLAYLLVPNLSSRFWKGFVTLMCMLVIGLVSLSSLLFGTHYAADVIAGLALGLAWTGLAYTLVEKKFPQATVENRERLQNAISLADLRAPGLFARRPMIGLVLILLGCISFAVLGYNILADGPLAQLDLAVYKALLAQSKAASSSVNELVLFGFFLGKQAVQWIALILSVYFLWQRYWLEFGILQISTQGGGLIKNLVIDYFSRPRPPEQLGFVTTELPSFPSGHAMGTIICYGFLAYLIVPRMPSLFWKWTVSLMILLLVLFEGFSRIAHGNHYLTDVLAGYSLGLTWLVLVCLLLEWIFIRRRRIESKELQ